ncbi:MAG: tRNA pseudouridine(55) synthase TruB [Nitrospirae bacterium]|nr:MAG: tRNA pseudouridine(55) synthase TruB [Nitrospirota bacterium]
MQHIIPDPAAGVLPCPSGLLSPMNIIINLNKPTDMSSQQAVTKVKRLLRAKKAGHTGTLDPLATGVLLVCLEEATKVSRFLLEMDKQYLVRAKLGERTDTFDACGVVTQRSEITGVTEAGLKEVVGSFRGEIEQVPPMYSAIKVGGRPLYSLARKGIEIERASRKVLIKELSLTGIDLPYIDLRVSCSKGTYIRTLCDDIGSRLGTGAHLVSLERERIGPFDVWDSVTLEELGGRDLAPDGRTVYSIDAALSGLDEVILDERSVAKLQNGVRIEADMMTAIPEDRPLKLKGPDGKLFAIGRVHAGVICIDRNLKL